MMKHSRLTMLIAIAAALSFAVVAGCSKSSKSGKSGIPLMGDTSGNGTGGTIGSTGTLPGSGTGTSSGTGGGDPVSGSTRQRLFKQINDLRTSQGVSPVDYDLRIEDVANAYAEICAQNRQYSPNLSGTPESRLRSGGINFSQCGETGMCDSDVLLVTVTKIWRELDQNVLLNPAFNRVGIGKGIMHYACDDEQEVWLVDLTD